MKRLLIKTENKIYYIKDGVRIEGKHDGLYGDVTNISGDVTNISGNVTGLSGNIDDCAITKEDRKKGIDIKELIK